MHSALCQVWHICYIIHLACDLQIFLRSSSFHVVCDIKVYTCSWPSLSFPWLFWWFSFFGTSGGFSNFLWLTNGHSSYHNGQTYTPDHVVTSIIACTTHTQDAVLHILMSYVFIGFGGQSLLIVLFLPCGNEIKLSQPVRRTITELFVVVGCSMEWIVNGLWYLSVVWASHPVCNPRGAMEARWTSNSKVVGSSPIGGVTEIFFYADHIFRHVWTTWTI